MKAKFSFHKESAKALKALLHTNQAISQRVEIGQDYVALIAILEDSSIRRLEFMAECDVKISQSFMIGAGKDLRDLLAMRGECVLEFDNLKATFSNGAFKREYDLSSGAIIANDTGGRIFSDSNIKPILKFLKASFRNSQGHEVVSVSYNKISSGCGYAIFNDSHEILNTKKIIKSFDLSGQVGILSNSAQARLSQKMSNEKIVFIAKYYDFTYSIMTYLDGGNCIKSIDERDFQCVILDTPANRFLKTLEYGEVVISGKGRSLEFVNINKSCIMRYFGEIKGDFLTHSCKIKAFYDNYKRADEIWLGDDGSCFLHSYEGIFWRVS